MSENNLDQTDLAPWILSLPCRVEIPPEKQDLLGKRGMAPTAYDEARQFPRFFCSGTEHRAALELGQTFPALARVKQWLGVYMLDVSRGGCRFLHAQQLYPGEHLRIVLLTGLAQTIEISWCRRIGPRCFEVGTRYIAPAEVPLKDTG